MLYAVMQTGLEPPSLEQLKEAFHQVPGLTALDARMLGRDACGVLGKGLELERASAMQSALAAQGVATEVVEEAALAQLPPPRQLTKVVFTPEALLMDNLLGRSFPLEWNSIWVIAAGRTRLTEFMREEVEKIVKVRQGRWMTDKLVREEVTREEQNDHLLLEIITRGAALRCHAVADRPDALLLFQYLGERRAKTPAANLCLFVQDLLRCAPAAILNHGALCMREAGDPSFCYPSQTAFYREITLLMWMDSSGRMQG